MNPQKLLLRALRAVLGAGLHTLGHTGSIQRAADDVITNARQVTDTAAADEHHGVLLQVVADAGDVASRRTRAILRSAEFGFFGVVVLTDRHTPRFCGHFCRIGAVGFAAIAFLPLRINWLIVGMEAPPMFLLKNSGTLAC